jgi:hypothetical protein
MSYVVEVNEGVVEATRQGVEWWYTYRPRFEASGRLREIKAACIIAGTVEVGPYERDDAEFMASHMVESGGMPKSAVKVKRGGDGRD